MPEENQRKGKLSDRHWLYSLKMVILSAARKGSGPPGLGDHIARSIHKNQIIYYYERKEVKMATLYDITERNIERCTIEQLKDSLTRIESCVEKSLRGIVESQIRDGIKRKEREGGESWLK